MKPIINQYFLIAGVFFGFSALGHGIFGHQNVLNFVFTSDLEASVITAIFYAWHIPTGENLIFSLAFLYMAFVRDQRKVLIAAIMIFAINVYRLCIFLLSTLLFNKNEMLTTIPTVIIMIAVYTLLYFAIKKAKTISV